MAEGMMKWASGAEAYVYLNAPGKRDAFGNFSTDFKSSSRIQMQLRCSMDGKVGDQHSSVEQSQITQIEMLNRSTVLVVFTNGDSVSVAADKVAQLALTSGDEYVVKKITSETE